MTAARLRDIVVGAVGLCLLAPLLILLIIVIAVIDGRPVFFTQIRSGQDARRFRVFKFRTMTDARDANGILLADADRVTWIGRILRKVRLDELPQFWNVLIGDMSLVGPRPLPPERLAGLQDGGWLRGSVRPGLTGWAQVNGNTLLSDVDKIALDEWYILNRSFKLDCQIIRRTLSVISQGECVNSIAIRRAHARSPHRRR